jgi:sulfur relay (sulfurtransferase) complex TusBCD TusD component (DsrE family)
MVVEELIIEGVQPGSMDLLSEWTLAADEVLVF